MRTREQISRSSVLFCIDSHTSQHNGIPAQLVEILRTLGVTDQPIILFINQGLRLDLFLLQDCFDHFYLGLPVDFLVGNILIPGMVLDVALFVMYTIYINVYETVAEIYCPQVKVSSSSQ
jgi:hypothetical protein